MSSIEPVTLDPTWRDAEEVAAMQSPLLRRMVSACADRHPRYRSMFQELGVDLGSIQSVDDLGVLPPTTKQALVEDPESFRLGEDEQRPMDFVLADVTYTAGTSSGRPTPVYQTAYDLRAILFAQHRMARIRGMTPDDRIVNLYPLAPFPHGGWVRPTQAAAVLGASVVTATGGSAEGRFPVTRRLSEVAALVVRHDPTVLWGVPSYLDRVMRLVEDRGGYLPSLRMLAVSGEPCDGSRRRSLLELAAGLGAKAPIVSDSLGATELQFSLVECPDGYGFHHPAPELAHIEVIDEDDQPVADGSPGRLAYTHLDRTGTVLLRFLVGDRAVIDRSPCPGCGWLGGRVVSHLGREGSFVKVRGSMINVDAAHSAVTSVDEVIDHRFDVSSSGGMDVLSVMVVVDQRFDETSVLVEVATAVREFTGVRPEVLATTLERIWSPEDGMKPARFVDRRSVDRSVPS